MDKGKSSAPHGNPDKRAARPHGSAKAKTDHKTNRKTGHKTAAAPKAFEGERIAKIMARAGLCSRRDAEVWIAEGRVAVNGKLLTSPAISVRPTDEVTVDGNLLAERERTRLFLFHKPRGLVTTNKDPEGRTTVFDYLTNHHPELPRLVSVGRLDINTEGLLLLTNDGGLARVLELPTTGWLRRYRVRANGEADQAALDRLADGVTIEGIHYAGIEATLDRQQGANSWLTIGLREGKNREIKRVLEHLGLVVNRLIRLSFGPFQLGELADGAIEEVRTRVLRDQLGTALAEAAGVDFRAEIPEPVRPVRPVRPMRSDRPERTGAPKSSHDRPRRETMRPHRAKPEPEPEVDKPRHRPKAGPRKHVSVLRAEAPAEGRRRTVQGETTDRKGRAVAVERRVAADKPGKSKISAAKRLKRNEAPGARPGRKPVADERRGPKASGGGRQDRRREGDNSAPRGPALKSGRPGKARGPASSGKRPPRGRG